MSIHSSLHIRFRVGGLILLLIGVGFLLIAASMKIPPSDASGNASRPTGNAQLVSYEILPMPDGEMCEWMPASSNASLVAALQQERQESRSGGPMRTVDFSQRKPLRMVQDP